MNKELLYLITQIVPKGDYVRETTYLVKDPKFEGVGIRATIVGEEVEVEVNNDFYKDYVTKYKKSNPRDLLITGILECKQILDEDDVLVDD